MKTSKKDRRTEVIDTAALLFKQRGYSAVTMRDIADKMGIKAASLYNHIASKQEILSIVIVSIAEEFTQGIREISASKESTTQKLKRIISQHVMLTAQNATGMAALNNDWMHLEDQLDYYLELRTNYESRFREIVLEGQKSGELKKIHPEIMIFTILSTLRNLYLWIPKKTELNHQDLAHNLSEMLLQGAVK